MLMDKTSIPIKSISKLENETIIMAPARAKIMSAKYSAGWACALCMYCFANGSMSNALVTNIKVKKLAGRSINSILFMKGLA